MSHILVRPLSWSLYDRDLHFTTHSRFTLHPTPACGRACRWSRPATDFASSPALRLSIMRYLGGDTLARDRNSARLVFDAVTFASRTQASTLFALARSGLGA